MQFLYTVWFCLMLYFHLLQGLQSGPFPSSFPTKILYTFPFSPTCTICPVPHPSHPAGLEH
jgi:hypothetical protein